MPNIYTISTPKTAEINKHALSQHDWLTVVNPTNRRSLLQACDKCGVVKSQNTVNRSCRNPSGEGLLSKELFTELQFTA